MRTKDWQRDKTHQKIRRRKEVLIAKDVPDREKYLEEDNRLNKINIGNIIKENKPKYDREEVKRFTFREILWFFAYQY